MEANMKLSLGLIAAFCVHFYTVSASIPAVIWGQDSAKAVPVVPAGHTLSSDDFSKIAEKLSQDAQQNILLFLQDKLSLEDITNYANVHSTGSDGSFHNLKSLMQTKSSGHIPRIASPSVAVETLQEKYAENTHNLEAPYSLDDISLDVDGHLIIVHLPNTPTSLNKMGESLKEIDNIIGSVSSAMESRGREYTAIYTAMESSKLDPQRLTFGRHLLAEDDNVHNYYKQGCFFFYAQTMTLHIRLPKPENKTSFVLKPGNMAASTCTDLKVDFTVDGFSSLGMSLTFAAEPAGYWTLTNWTVEYKYRENPQQSVSFKTDHEVFAPIGDSYHCSKPTLVRNDTMLDVSEFQVQAVNLTKQEFGRANDCVGFFTIPIWSGIISTLLLLSILSFGILLLANITTMDRFDDPKGKTISVNVGE